MIDKQIVTRLVEAAINPEDLFLVDVTVSPAGDIEVVVDSDTRVSIEQCAALSRSVEAGLDREVEDFSLTVASAGIGEPFKVGRQFTNCVGKPIDVVMKKGGKVSGVLSCSTEDFIEIKYEVMETVDGKKRKQKVEKVEKIKKTEIKSVCEALTIK